MFMFRSRKNALVKRAWKARRAGLGDAREDVPQALKGAALQLLRRLTEAQLDLLVTALDSGGVEPGECVLVPRVPDAGAGGAALAPHLLMVRVWRWPDLHDAPGPHGSAPLRRLPCCAARNDHVYVCANPYHWARVLQTGKTPNYGAFCTGIGSFKSSFFKKISSASILEMGCGADGCGRGGGAGGVEEGAPPLPSRPPPPSLEQQQQQDVPEGWARFSWVAPVPKRVQLQQPQPQAGSFSQRSRSQKGGAARRLQHSQSQPHLHRHPLQQAPSSPGSLRQQGHLHRLQDLQLQPQQSLPAKQTSRLHPYGSSLKRIKQGKQGRLQVRHHHDEDDGDGDGEAAAARLVHSSSGSSSSLNSRVSVASSKSGGGGGGGGVGVGASGGGGASGGAMSGSGTSGAAASYSTLRRGLKVTTSKIMSATSTVRRQPSSPAASAAPAGFGAAAAAGNLRRWRSSGGGGGGGEVAVAAVAVAK
ncbi:AT-rich interactive domain-containing protein 1B-like [Penaeus vannamei]|uniref:AT-rich interactive domain-containing protein 1B-like n=1 Tax=Penaeus vannamei TaxID=6689 RepID=UPI00387FAAD6